jgi:hypothetical protein
MIRRVFRLEIDETCDVDDKLLQEENSHHISIKENASGGRKGKSCNFLIAPKAITFELTFLPYSFIQLVFRKRNSTQTTIIVDTKRCQTFRVLKRLDICVQKEVAGELFVLVDKLR